jgi:hypothetical protein
MDQVPIKYTIIFHCRILQNLTKFGFLVLKTNHLATLKKMQKLVFEEVLLSRSCHFGSRCIFCNFSRLPAAPGPPAACPTPSTTAAPRVQLHLHTMHV